MSNNLNQLVIRNILNNEEYTRRVLPFIQPEYFEGVYSQLFKQIAKYVHKYNSLPTIDAFKVQLDEADSLSDEQFRHAQEVTYW